MRQVLTGVLLVAAIEAQRDLDYSMCKAMVSKGQLLKQVKDFSGMLDHCPIGLTTRCT